MKNESPSYRDAYEGTAHVIRARAERYRNLVVAVTLVSLASLLFALGTWSWHPLVGLLALLPLCGIFFFLDARELLRWQQLILDIWAQGRLEMSAYCQTIRANKALPSRTLESMLETLPRGITPRASDNNELATRRAVALTLRQLQSHRSVRTFIVMAAETVAVLSLACAAIIRSPLPLLGLLSLPLLVGLEKGVTILTFRRWRREISQLQRGVRGVASLRSLFSELGWHGIPARTKAAALDWLAHEPEPSAK